MRVSFAIEPAPGVANEDYFLAVPGLVLVLDGVTTPLGLATGCVHGTPWYVRRLAAHMAVIHATEPAGNLGDLVAAAIEAVSADHGGACDLSHPGTPSSTVCMLRAGDERADWLVLSDSSLVLDRDGSVDVITDHQLKLTSNAERAALTRSNAPVGSKEHRALVLGLVESQRSVRNQPGGYWLAAATPAAARHALTGTETLTGHRRLTRAALLTDGASRAVDMFGRYDWAGLLRRAEEHGPAAVIADVRAAERADQHGSARPRSKIHDDATAALAVF